MKIVTRANMSAEAKLYGRGANILRKMREKVLPGDQINTIIEDLLHLQMSLHFIMGQMKSREPKTKRVLQYLSSGSPDRCPVSLDLQSEMVCLTGFPVSGDHIFL